MEYYVCVLFRLILCAYLIKFGAHGDCRGGVSRCQWVPWNSWSYCSSSCGGGRRTRDRSFCCNAELAHDSRACMADCGWDYDSRRSGYHDSESCNEFCYNGGTYYHSYSGYCSCSNRYKGTCCGDVVTCGRPSSISHGSFSGNDFTYGNRVTYKCDYNWGMTVPSQAVRTCQGGGYWSGSLPTCLYLKSCNSNPCKNGATCNNLLGDYRCVCRSGWSGRNCELDIQPPVVHGCPANKNFKTSNMTVRCVWKEPSIRDPHGKAVRVTKNYRVSWHDFPWGDFTVNYHGIKPSNGLTAECSFKVTVRPNACQELSPPVNGIMLCNGWRRDYSQICMFECKADNVFPPGHEQTDIYVCGATGHWLPADPAKRCISKELFPDREEGKTPTCTDSGDKQILSELYIDRLNTSAFGGLCRNHRSYCTETNVVVTC